MVPKTLSKLCTVMVLTRSLDRTSTLPEEEPYNQHDVAKDVKQVINTHPKRNLITLKLSKRLSNQVTHTHLNAILIINVTP